MERGGSELEHLCWDVSVPVAVVSLGGRQACKGMFTSRWLKVTPKEGDKRQHTLNTRQVTLKCTGAGGRRSSGASLSPCCPAGPAGPVLLCQPEGNPCQHHWGPAWPHSGSLTRDTSPRGQAERGQPNPTPAEPSSEEGGGGGSGHGCQQLPPLPDPSSRAQPPHLLAQSKHGMVPNPCWSRVGLEPFCWQSTSLPPRRAGWSRAPYQPQIHPSPCP